MKKIYKFLLALVLLSGFANAQVTVTGGSTATYSNVNAAFAAINAGTHFGAILIDITASTIEGSTGYIPTPLLASGQSSANYTSIILRPSATATITGDVATGRGVLELDGVDNFTFNGDIIGGPVQKDLTISCVTAPNIAATAAIRFIGRTTLGLGATNNTIINCIIIGNTEGNNGISGSTVTNSYGIYAGSNGTNLTTGGLGDNYDNITISNNDISRAYFGIWLGSTTANPGDNNLISGNNIGSNTVGQTITLSGISLSSMVTSTVTLNEIFNLQPNTTVSPYAIQIGGTSSNSVVISRNKIHEIKSLNITSGYGAYGINLAGGNNHLIVNNVIYDISGVNYSSTSTTFNGFGIRLASGTGHKVYYNSVNLFGLINIGTSSATSIGSSAFVVTSTAITGIDIRNNIFCNTQTSTLTTTTIKKFMSVWFPTSYNFLNATLNNNSYNILNDADHFVGKIGTTNNTNEAADLSSWQIFSQVNNASNDNVSVPLINSSAPFISNVNLNFSPNTITPIESGAVLIPALGTNIDYNANVRPLAGINPNTNPDMGAYEFDGLAGVATDAGIIALINPLTFGCYSATETVSVTIKNYGTSSISNIPVTVIVSGTINQTLTGTYAGPIAPSATFNFSVGTINMTAAGVYSFNATTSLAGDLNTPNDAMSEATRTVIAPSLLPQFVSFTGFTGSNLTTFFPDWREGAGATGPNGTTSLWTSQTNFMSTGNVNARLYLYGTTNNEWLVGPKILATANTYISFDAGITAGTTSPFASDAMGSDDMVRVMVSTDCGVTYTPIYTISATNSLSPSFTNFNISLGAFNGQNIIVAILGQDGPVDDIEAYYFQLDNINLYNVGPIDAGVTALVAPLTTTCFGASESIIVDVKNYGTASLSNIPVSVLISGPITQTVSGTLAGPLASGATTTFNVGSANMSIGGTYTLVSKTGVAGDPNSFNDSIVDTRVVNPIIGISGNNALCSGGSTTLTAVGAGTSYTWSTAANTQSIVVTPLSNTIYTLTASDGTCSTVMTTTVSVSNPTITGLGAAVCGSTTVGTLTANAFAPVSWYASPTSTTVLSTGNTFTATAVNTTTYYAEAVSSSSGSLQTGFAGGNGCGGGNMFDVTATNGTIVIDSLDVNTSVSAASTFSVFLYYKMGTYLGNETNSAAWIAWDTVLVTSAGANQPTRVVPTNTLSLPNNQLYAIYVNYAANYTNGTLLYSNSDLDLQTGAGLCSQFGGVNAGRMFNGNVFYSKPGCTSPKIPVTLTVTSAPAITLGASQLSVCPGTSVNIGATGANTYTWSTGANGSLISVTPTATTIYTLTGETGPGCSGTASITITSNTVPVVGITSSASLICVGQTASLTANGANSYLWNTSSTNTVLAVSPTITTSYTVTGTAANSCTNVAMFTQSVSACTGVAANTAFNNLISVFPNPSNGIITTEFNFEGQKEIVITNSVGQIITSIKTTNNSETINLEKYAKGMYFVKVMSNQNSVNYRIILQ